MKTGVSWMLQVVGTAVVTGCVISGPAVPRAAAPDPGPIHYTTRVLAMDTGVIWTA